MNEIVLQAGADALVVESSTPAWCRVWLHRAGAAPRFLGAEALSFIHQRLSGALCTAAPGFILSLAEAHHTLRLRCEDAQSFLDIEDESGTRIAALPFDPPAWRATLESS